MQDKRIENKKINDNKTVFSNKIKLKRMLIAIGFVCTIIIVCIAIYYNKLPSVNASNNKKVLTVNQDANILSADNEVIQESLKPTSVSTTPPKATWAVEAFSTSKATLLATTIPPISITEKVITVPPRTTTAIPTKKPTKKPTITSTLTPTITPITMELSNVSYDAEANIDKLNSLITKQTYSQEDIDYYLANSIIDNSSAIYDYESMLCDIQVLYSLFPEKIKVNYLETTVDGRGVIEIILGNINATKHILLHGSMHAREYLTSQVLMNQLEYYLKHYNEGTYNGVSYTDLFNDVAVHIVPMVNPDGVTISQFGTSKIKSQQIKDNLYSYYKRDYAAQKIYCDFSGYLQIWKSNAIGVDINKNFNNSWLKYDGPTAPSRLNYKGLVPESEPETRALVGIVNYYNIVSSIAYHTAGSVIYWDYNQNGKLRSSCYDLVSAVANITGYEVIYSSTKELNPAGFSDWMVLVKGIPALTLELGKGTAPLPISEFWGAYDCTKDIWPQMCYMYR